MNNNDNNYIDLIASPVNKISPRVSPPGTGTGFCLNGRGTGSASAATTEAVTSGRHVGRA